MTQICLGNVEAATVRKLRAKAVPRPYLQNQAAGGWIWSACCSPPTPALWWTLQSTGVELVQSPQLPFWWDFHYPPFLRELVTCPSPELVRSGCWLDLKSVLSTPHHAALNRTCYCCAKSLQSCLTLPDAMDRSLLGSSVHGILQARIPEWVTMPSSRGSSWLRGRTRVSYVSCIGRWFFFLNH